MLSTTDPTAAAEAKFKFVEFMFSKPEEMPAKLKWEWLGMTTVQPPVVAGLTVSREQDPTKLYEAVANGLPVSLISCPTDAVMLMDKIERIMKGHFNKVEVRYIENGSHAPFIDHKDKFVDALVDLARRMFDTKQ